MTAIFPLIAKPSKFSPRFEEMEVCIPNSRRGSKTEESVSPTKVLESPTLAHVLNLWVMVRPEGFEVWQGRRGDALQRPLHHSVSGNVDPPVSTLGGRGDARLFGHSLLYVAVKLNFSMSWNRAPLKGERG